jgi:transcriptional regulator with XRE-family HTH domain
MKMTPDAISRMTIAQKSQKSGVLMNRQVRIPRRHKSTKENEYTSKRTSASAKQERQGIGARIRFLRRQRDMTLDQLSNTSNLTKSYVSKVERGLSVPSISTAMKIAESFNITVSQLLGEDGYEGAISIVRKNERPSFMRDGSSTGYDYEMIAAPKKFKSMEPFIMKPPLQFQDKRLFEHSGEELIFVLSGSVEVEVSGKLVRLDSGDTMYFDAHLPHRTRSVGNKNASVLVVISGMKQK